MEESKDADARWLKKGKRCYFGYKGFIRTTEGQGFIQEVLVTSANESEVKQLPKLLEDFTGERLYADKAYASKAHDELLKSKKIKNRIMRKASRRKGLTSREKQFNRLISKRRYIVEQAFGTLKRKFHCGRAQYFTKAKVQAQLYLKAMCFNLLKAVNLMVIA